MDHLDIGILGYGDRGRQLYKHFHRPEEKVFVTAIADPTLKQELSEKGEDLTTYMPLDTPEELFAHFGVQAVVIATPDHLHEKHACEALYRGKHVYLEKPIAITPEGCDRIIKAASSSRVVYAGHNLRHFTVIKKIKEVIDSGAIGEVKTIWCRHPVSYGRWGYFAEGRWHKKRSLSGGLLIHKGCHDLDVIHWLAGGRTTRVVGMGALSVWHDQPGEPDVEDMSSVLMQLNNGVQATYSQCHFAHFAAREYVIVGTKGTLRNQDDNPERAVVQLFQKRRMDLKPIPTQEWRFPPEEGVHGDADERIASEFIGVVRGTQAPSISIEDAAWAVKTGYAATESLRNGSIPVEVK